MDFCCQAMIYTQHSRQKNTECIQFDLLAPDDGEGLIDYYVMPLGDTSPWLLTLILH